MTTNNIQPIINNLQQDIKTSKHCASWFYQDHVLVVEKLALDLLKLYPKANKDAVILSVWFHDVGRAHGYHKNHDLYGADYAQKILTKNNVNKDFIKLVVNACKTHSCEDNGIPSSLEGKILATADALAHFHNGFYLKILYFWSKDKDQDYEAIQKKLFNKINRDFNNKIFFNQVKEKMQPTYQAWLTIIKEAKLLN